MFSQLAKAILWSNEANAKLVLFLFGNHMKLLAFEEETTFTLRWTLLGTIVTNLNLSSGIVIRIMCLA
jgi:hypothetical protein